MEGSEDAEKRLKKIYAHFLRLNLQGYLKSRDFDIVCIEYDVENIWQSNLLAEIQIYNRWGTQYSLHSYPESWADSLFKNFLNSIFLKSPGKFVEIIPSLLSDYSKWNARQSISVPIDDETIKVFGEDLLNLDYDEQDVIMYFERAGYNLEELLNRETIIAIRRIEPKEEPKKSFQSKDVFIVHGHDESIKDSVALYVSQLGLTPIILSDKPSGGDTLIEKLEHHSDVRYAIVLLTPDDVGQSRRDNIEKTRARQNVILELGLFIGLLGRENVCPIVNGVGELPSDFIGVVYVPYDPKWKLHLVRELVKAGFEIPAEKL